MEQLKNLETLRLEVRGLVEPFVRGLLAVAGENITCVMVFGSATGPDFVAGHSNINLAMEVRDISYGFLQKCLKHVSAASKRRIVAPLLLTRKYIDSSLDVFPIEFLDIRETAVVLYGDSPFTNVTFDDSSLRLECEQQLKGSLLRIRQAYLELGLVKRGLEKVLGESLNSLIPVFRAMLVLKGIKPPRGKKEIVNSVSEAFGVDPGVFGKILKLKLEMNNVPREAEEQIFREYTKNIEDLALAMDAFVTKDKP